MAFIQNASGDLFTSHIAYTIRAGGGMGRRPMVCVTGDVTHTLTARADSSEDGTGRGTPIDNGGTEIGVRRLIPLECERLQGFPDGWTDGQSDAQRYRQLGNSVAIPVVEWIAKRLVEVDQCGSAESLSSST